MLSASAVSFFVASLLIPIANQVDSSTKQPGSCTRWDTLTFEGKAQNPRSEFVLNPSNNEEFRLKSASLTIPKSEEHFSLEVFIYHNNVDNGNSAVRVFHPDSLIVSDKDLTYFFEGEDFVFNPLSDFVEIKLQETKSFGSIESFGLVKPCEVSEESARKMHNLTYTTFLALNENCTSLSGIGGSFQMNLAQNTVPEPKDVGLITSAIVLLFAIFLQKFTRVHKVRSPSP